MSNINQVVKAWNEKEILYDIATRNAAQEISLRLKGNAMHNFKKGDKVTAGKAISGGYPTVRTGTLRNSITGTSARVGFLIYKAIVGADTVYARAIEEGAPYNPPSWKDGQKFPFIEPAVQRFVRSGLASRIIRKHLGAI